MLPVKRKRRMGREFHSEKNDTICTLSVVTYSVQYRLPKKLQAPPGAFVRDRCLKSTISFPLCVSASHEAWSIPHPDACRPEISLRQDHDEQMRMKSGKALFLFRFEEWWPWCRLWWASSGKRLQQREAVGSLAAKSGKVYHDVYAIGYYL